MESYKTLKHKKRNEWVWKKDKKSTTNPLNMVIIIIISFSRPGGKKPRMIFFAVEFCNSKVKILVPFWMKFTFGNIFTFKGNLNFLLFAHYHPHEKIKDLLLHTWQKCKKSKKKCLDIKYFSHVSTFSLCRPLQVHYDLWHKRSVKRKIFGQFIWENVWILQLLKLG